jgi:hypothetical protein
MARAQANGKRESHASRNQYLFKNFAILKTFRIHLAGEFFESGLNQLRLSAGTSKTI